MTSNVRRRERMSERKDRVQVYSDHAGGYRWRKKAPNGEIISWGESYTVKSHAIEAAHRINGDEVEYETDVDVEFGEDEA